MPAISAINALTALSAIFGDGSPIIPPPDDYEPALQFNDERNSQYLGVI